LNVLHRDRTLGITLFIGSAGDDPVNVAVWDNYLEQTHQERHLLEVDPDPMLELRFGPFNGVQMLIARFFRQRNQAVLLESGHKPHSQPVDWLQIVRRSTPAIHQHGLRLDLLVTFGPQQHLSKMLILTLAIALRPIGVVHPVVNRIELSCSIF